MQQYILIGNKSTFTIAPLEVIVKEITEERGLHDARDPHDPVRGAVQMILDNPINDVHGTVDAQCGYVMAGHVFYDLLRVEHDELQQSKTGA